MSSPAPILIKAVIIMAAGQALPSQFRPPNSFSFPKRELGRNGRTDLFVLTGVSSSNGYTMMLMLTRRFATCA